MKAHFFFQLIIVLIADAVLGVAIADSESGYTGGCILFIDMIIGPLQVVPSLVMLFMNRYNNKYFWAYIILAICTIATMVISAYCFGLDGYEDGSFLNMLFFSFLLAHYFVFVLYKTNQINLHRI